MRAVAGISKIVLNPFNRVALARAVYARTKYVLLDDPLSAVVSAFNVTLVFSQTRVLQRTVTLRVSYSSALSKGRY